MFATPKHQVESNAPATHLLTIEEYLEFGEPTHGYTELLEGRLLTSPSPDRRHMKASGELYEQVDGQLPDHLSVVQDLDIDLRFLPAGQPGFSRRPDLIVHSRAAGDRVDEQGGLIRADEVLVVIEIVSPGSRRTDRITKYAEYAEAGIPHYWLVDTERPTSLLACHLTEQFGYQQRQEATGLFTTDEPFPLTVDLDALG
ncbi:Uma2 family endonuclease [Actinokineospora sp. NBRC 105648]|uniref:Uma2 family endonuclease n=1 Tax=Actinokineospora sp. NBRC 105648 TaxID=3032206 RepID=UPI0024A2A733|nr:Uma2 family endonuclease [Actinokineospora sp. NBRC 105648]GLZ41648.1 hypothetical protein Acsp05_52720 [Actinokineospora sp. NBRC 105648]